MLVRHGNSAKTTTIIRWGEAAMPIKGIRWDPLTTANRDVHVLRGQSSADLTVDRMQFVVDPITHPFAHAYLADPNNNHDVDLTFTVDPVPADDVFENQGIEVDANTGAVTLTQNQPPPDGEPRTNNFILEVVASDPADDSQIDNDFIRVHIHTSVTDFALTPATLTIRPAQATRTAPEQTAYQFTLRAVFDDQTMGDLTAFHGVVWSSNPPDRVDPATGKISIGVGDAEGTTIVVTATLPNAFGNGARTANVHVGRPWRDDPDVPRASIVVGGGWPGTTLPDTAPNVLFLSDGYPAADGDAFRQTVTTEVHHLKHDRLVRPYDLLCTSMNFWSAFVPANARGIAVRCEVYNDKRKPAAKDAWRPVPPPDPPPRHEDWSVEHLIYQIGLPIPDDAHKTNATLRDEWDARTQNDLPRDRISGSIINEWKRIATRAFIEELDNFPGMALGEPPAANTKNGEPSLSLHSDRCGRAGLDALLSLLQAEAASGVQFGPGANIGAAWARPAVRQNLTDYALHDVIRVADNPRPMFVCTTAGTSDLSEPADYAPALAGDTITDGTAVFRCVQPTFDNSRFVIVMSSFPVGRGRNNRRDGDVPAYIAMNVQSSKTIPTMAATNHVGLAFNNITIAEDANLNSCRVTAHELGHSLGLGDEYVDNERRYPNDQSELITRLNLQTADDLTPGSVIEPDRIRWNWHRVRKAAVVRDAITSVAAGAFRIPVVAGQAAQFQLNDIVLLRLRVAGLFIDAAPDATVSAQLQIAIAPSTSASSDYVVVQAASGTTITPDFFDPFIPGSILFVPVPAPASVRDPDDYPFAEMVAKNVKDLISDTGNALYERPLPGDLTDDMIDNKEIQHPTLTGLTPGLPGRPFCFRVEPTIVGLYGGGAQYARGIYHPAGLCVMRKEKNSSFAFCAVCRYIMVDYVDPFRHFEIDRDYDDIYPLR